MKRQFVDANRSAPGSPVSVAIVLPPRCWAGSVHLARELLMVAGTLAARSSDPARSALFRITCVGASRAPVASFGDALLQPHLTTCSTAQHAVVIVPAQFAPSGEADADERALCGWIARQHAGGALVLSLGGAVLLAKSGLLDGRDATGLRSERALFERHFPRVRYNPARRLIAGDRLITVCGIGPTADAIAHVVERFVGAAAARRFLRHTSTEVMPAPERLGLWSARYKRHRDAPVLAAQEIVERELQALPPAGRLAAQVGLSERALSRRWAEATGLTLRAYVAALRLEQAQALLRDTELPLAHVAAACGFGSASALCRAFTQRFGEPPRRFRLDARNRPPAAAAPRRSRALRASNGNRRSSRPSR
jgi:transcriptional regulator GlxA family with amidase domain